MRTEYTKHEMNILMDELLVKVYKSYNTEMPNFLLNTQLFQFKYRKPEILNEHCVNIQVLVSKHQCC